MKIYLEGQPFECPEGATLKELADMVYTGKTEAEQPVLAYVDGRLRELFHHVREESNVRFADLSDKAGFETMRRSASMLFLAAAERLYEGSSREAVLHFSIGNGFYFSFGSNIKIDDSFLEKMTLEMRAMVSGKLRFEKYSVSTIDARKLFAARGMEDKERLFRTRIASRVNIYRLGTYVDYNYGYMTYDTSSLGTFSLVAYRDGVLLNLPSRAEPGRLRTFMPSEKLMDAQLMGEAWAARQNIGNVGSLNARIIDGGASESILVSEAMQEGRIAEIARQIAHAGNVKFVMVAGPSSSGKTTFSQRLAVQLRAEGMVPHYIGLDNYFVDRDSMPAGPDGKRDFEGLAAIDVTKFREDMSALLQGARVPMPTFDFIEGRRVYKGDSILLKRHDLLVIEGIHGLNGAMTEGLPEENIFRIYISALTQLGVDMHNRIPSGDGRLLRRIVRDHRTRGYNASQTLGMWESVRSGEERNIFPYQESADVFFNSALPYEIAALKTYAQPLLFQVSEDDPSFQEAKRLLKFLDYFIAIPSDGIPANSILREFIGGGCFRL